MKFVKTEKACLAEKFGLSHFLYDILHSSTLVQETSLQSSVPEQQMALSPFSSTLIDLFLLLLAGPEG